jgi:hypothetical protein
MKYKLALADKRYLGFGSSLFSALPATLHWRYGGGQDANIDFNYASAVVPADE